jgi:NADH-quinone oxidoreductase subunit F
VPLGVPWRDVIARGGGDPAALACVFPGGPSSAPLGAADLATPLDPDALRARGSSLGTAALLVVSRARAPFDLAVSLAAFFERESCGQCPPCVRGTESLHKIARALRSGSARAKDVADVAEVSGFMAMHGYCAHCRAAAASVSGLLSLRRTEVAQAVSAGSGGAGVGQAPVAASAGRYDPFAVDSPERAAIEAALEGLDPDPSGRAKTP